MAFARSVTAMHTCMVKISAYGPWPVNAQIVWASHSPSSNGSIFLLRLPLILQHQETSICGMNGAQTPSASPSPVALSYKAE